MFSRHSPIQLLRSLYAFRTLTTESLAVFMPFRVQEVYDNHGIYYGNNVISKNMIIADRRRLLNGNAFILDITKIDPFTDKSIPDCDIVLGGFPCQDFSIIWKQPGLNGTRGGLFRHFAEFVDAKKPKAFVAENVKGLLTANKGNYTIHNANLNQIFTYVKNKQAEPQQIHSRVAGMLLYAQTTNEIQPNGEYSMSGNKIYVQTLDLNCEFKSVAKQLNTIIKKHFKIDI